MTPMDAFIARANIARMRLQLATSVDTETQATLHNLLEEQLRTLRVGEPWEESEADQIAARGKRGVSASGEITPLLRVRNH